MRDLHEQGDNAWTAQYHPPQDWADEHAEPGRAKVYGTGSDLTVVTFGNGLPMSLRVARRLAREGIDCGVVDLRWLAPLPVADVLEQARASGRVLIADETRATGGVAEAVITALVDNAFYGVIRRVSSADSFIPLGTAAQHVLLTESQIEEAALAAMTDIIRPAAGRVR